MLVANTKISAGRRLALIGCYDNQKPSGLVAGKTKPMKKPRPVVCYKAPTEKKAREVGEELAELLGIEIRKIIDQWPQCKRPFHHHPRRGTKRTNKSVNLQHAY